MSDPSGEATVTLRRLEWNGEASTWAEDQVAAEAPLEIRIAGVPVAVVMRTPGHDEELVRGFLLSERIANSPEAIVSIRYCADVDIPEAEENVVQVVLDHAVDIAALRRNMYASSSCGVCGKASIERAMATGGEVGDSIRVGPTFLYSLPARLREGQSGFEATGGIHAGKQIRPMARGTERGHRHW